MMHPHSAVRNGVRLLSSLTAGPEIRPTGFLGVPDHWRASHEEIVRLGNGRATSGRGGETQAAGEQLCSHQRENFSRISRILNTGGAPSRAGIAPLNADHASLDANLVRFDVDGFHGLVGGLKTYVAPFAVQILHRGLVVSD